MKINLINIVDLYRRKFCDGHNILVLFIYLFKGGKRTCKIDSILQGKHQKKRFQNCIFSYIFKEISVFSRNNQP